MIHPQDNCPLFFLVCSFYQTQEKAFCLQHSKAGRHSDVLLCSGSFARASPIVHHWAAEKPSQRNTAQQRKKRRERKRKVRVTSSHARPQRLAEEEKEREHFIGPSRESESTLRVVNTKAVGSQQVQGRDRGAGETISA